MIYIAVIYCAITVKLLQRSLTLLTSRIYSPITDFCYLCVIISCDIAHVTEHAFVMDFQMLF